MFSLIFKYKIMESLRQKEVVFWNILFPLMMATLFFLTIRPLDTADRLEPIPVAAHGSFAREVLPQIRMENDESLFQIVNPGNEEEALLNDEISGIIRGEDWRMDLTVAKDNLNTAVLSTVVATTRHRGELIETMMRKNPSEDTLNQALERMTEAKNHVVSAEDNVSRNISNAYYFALLGMVCLGPSVLGIALVEEIHPQSDFLSSRRVSIAPMSRFRYLIAGSAAQLTLSLLIIGLVIVYMAFALGVDFGSQLGPILVSVATGSVIGILFGMALGLWIPGRGNTKIGIAVGLYIASSFFAGMMNQQVRFLVETRAPWFAAINPGSIITRMFYSLYYYGTPEHWMIQWRGALMAIGVLLVLVFVKARKMAR